MTRRSLSRSLGEFVGHIVKAVRSDPSKETERHVVREDVEEHEHGDVTLRRTTIEEIEFKKPHDP